MFSQDIQHSPFDDEIRLNINALEPHEKDVLKEAINGLLQLVILGWKRIKEEMHSYTGKGSIGIVIPFTLRSSSLFQKELRSVLPKMKVNLYTWKDIRDHNV